SGAGYPKPFPVSSCRQNRFLNVNESHSSTGSRLTERSGFGRLLKTYPAVAFLLPFVVYLLTNSLEPSPPISDEPGAGTALLGLIEYRHYPLVYTCKILPTIAAIVPVFPAYRQFPWRL